jgi:hypothetical protein
MLESLGQVDTLSEPSFAQPWHGMTLRPSKGKSPYRVYSVRDVFAALKGMKKKQDQPGAGGSHL